MDNKELSALTDQELLEEAKKMRSFSLTNALLIGILIGIVVYSIYKSTFGLVMLIPLYFIHKMVNDPKNKRIKELETLLKDRNLKKPPAFGFMSQPMFVSPPGADMQLS